MVKPHLSAEVAQTPTERHLRNSHHLATVKKSKGDLFSRARIILRLKSVLTLTGMLKFGPGARSGPRRKEGLRKMIQREPQTQDDFERTEEPLGEEETGA
jgi:hypothetical protein